MLILTRSEDEQIMIGQDIKIMVVGIDCKSKRVRIGIEAPKDLPIYRKEVFDRIAHEVANQ